MSAPRNEAVSGLARLVAMIFGRAVGVVAIKAAIIVVGLGLLYGAIAFLGALHDLEHLVSVENATGQTVTVTLDDEPPITIAPRESWLLRPSSGPHRVVVRSGSDALQDDTITLPSSVWGFRGVYLVGESGWATVRRDASGLDAPDRASVRRFVPAGRFFAMPDGVDAELSNTQFYVTRPPLEDATFGDATLRLCTYDEPTRRVGCDLCDDVMRCTTQDRSAARPFTLDAPPP